MTHTHTWHDSHTGRRDAQSKTAHCTFPHPVDLDVFSCSASVYARVCGGCIRPLSRVCVWVRETWLVHMCENDLQRLSSMYARVCGGCVGFHCWIYVRVGEPWLIHIQCVGETWLIHIQRFSLCACASLWRLRRTSFLGICVSSWDSDTCVGPWKMTINVYVWKLLSTSSDTWVCGSCIRPLSRVCVWVRETWFNQSNVKLTFNVFICRASVHARVRGSLCVCISVCHWL